MDTHIWVAVYRDGTVISEADQHVWADVNPTQVDRLYALDAYGGIALCVMVPGGMMPELFRRRAITISMDGTEGARSSMLCMGWQDAYVWLAEDGSVTLTVTKD